MDGTGEEIILKTDRVEFDTMFDSEMHLSFAPIAIGAFLEEVHSYLDDSTLLLSTESGSFRTGGSGTDFQDDMYFLTEHPAYDNNKSLEENLRALESQ